MGICGGLWVSLWSIWVSLVVYGSRVSLGVHGSLWGSGGQWVCPFGSRVEWLEAGTSLFPTDDDGDGSFLAQEDCWEG